MSEINEIIVKGATEHNLKKLDVTVKRNALTVITGVSGSGKSSLAFDTILAESQRRFFYTLSHYSRQFLDLGDRPAVVSVTGLSPSISLAQNETAPSRRATLGSLTDISELLAVCYARFGAQHCPKHGLPTSSTTKEEISKHIYEQAVGQNIALFVPVAHSKKGVFKAQLNQFATKGFNRAWIDGSLMELDPLPELVREEKHTIKILIDLLKVKEQGSDRLNRAIETTLELGQGFGEWLVVENLNLQAKKWEMGNLNAFSIKGGCPECGYSWPRLDSRYFNSNSLGRCADCEGYGVVDAAQYAEVDQDADSADSFADEYCQSCQGTGVQAESGAITLGGQRIHEMLNLPLSQLRLVLKKNVNQGSLSVNPAFQRVFEEIDSGLLKLIDMNLSYLSLARRIRSLSGGEAQRVKLAGILSESLRGILYVLDEPSQGLHHSELATVIRNLHKLRDDGNTVIVVDHDESVMRAADEIIDMGPTGGAAGGYILAKFKPSESRQYLNVSKTAEWLNRKVAQRSRKIVSRDKFSFLEIQKPILNNLKMKSVKFPLEAMTVVTGVSGAGKSSLVLGVVFQNLLDIMNGEGGVATPTKGKQQKVKWKNCETVTGFEALNSVHLIDRRPVAKSSVSMPATYLDLTADIRDLYANLPDSQVLGLTAKSFSLHLEGGRCPECKGRGVINLTMKFLADARITCTVCLGKRFRDHVLQVKFKDLSINDVLNLSIDEALEHFKNHRKLQAKLLPAHRLGLGYLKLGQPSASLSGGEAQRLKMVPFFTKKIGAGSVLILDEPTTGLHFEDVDKLISIMRELVDLGATLIVVEHSEDVRWAADWQIDIGPKSAAEGGEILFEGDPHKYKVT
ncbi:MAG: hypothetical protein NT027_12065 [Proteobacteria bacterium]|nr:hypothetical protein [Pseudomonadota bacterium]